MKIIKINVLTKKLKLKRIYFQLLVLTTLYIFQRLYHVILNTIPKFKNFIVETFIRFSLNL